MFAIFNQKGRKIMKTADNENPDKITRAALSIVLLLILLAMASCSTPHHGSFDGGTAYTSSQDGYIDYQTDKILVTRYVGADDLRTMTKRNWGLDGTHFIEEEEYLDSRPDLINDLLSGKTIQFSL